MTEKKGNGSEQNLLQAEESLIGFPCHFPMTVIGHADDTLIDRVVAAIVDIAEGFDRDDVTVRASSGGRYLAVRFEVWVTSKDQLDRLYRRLHALEGVRFLL